MAGQKRNHVFPWLNQDRVNVIWVNNTDCRHFVGQLLPYVFDVDQIPDLYVFYVQEVRIPVPAPVTGYDGVGILAADGDTGLRQHCRACRHILVVSPEIDRHLQIHCRDTQYTEHLIRQSVVRHGKRDDRHGDTVGQVSLPDLHQPLIVGLDGTIEFLIGHGFLCLV